jgi:hypothetical protein
MNYQNYPNENEEENYENVENEYQPEDYEQFYQQNQRRISYDPYINRPNIYKKKDKCEFCGGNTKYCPEKCRMLRFSLEAHAGRDSSNQVIN